jgi:hypothetical protein
MPGCITLKAAMPSPSRALLLLAILATACSGPRNATWSDVNPPEAYVATLPPGALVAVNGVEVGKGPLSFPVADGSQTYALRVTAPGFEPLEASFDGAKLGGTKLELVLRPVGFGSQRLLLAGEPVGLAQAAAALLRADRPREALAYAQASMAAGDSPQAHRAAGEAYRRLGDGNRSIQELSIYVNMAPDAPDRKTVEQLIAAARKDIQMSRPAPALE